MRWVLYIIVIILMIMITDAFGRLIVLKGQTRLDFRASTTSGNHTLLVYFPGILADGVKSSLQVAPIWQEYGDVLLVSYEGDRFIAEDVVRTVSLKVASMAPDYEQVVFIGSSMGGLLAYDTISKIKHLDLKIKLLLVDAPTKRSDFQSPLDKMSSAMYVWWAGPISNLFSKLYFNATFRGPKEENIEPGVNQRELDKRVAEAKSSKLSWQNDEIRYIITHGPLTRNVLNDVETVYIRSKRDDDTVRPGAIKGWKQAEPGITQMHVDSTHVGYNERPKAWQYGFTAALDVLAG